MEIYIYFSILFSNAIFESGKTTILKKIQLFFKSFILHLLFNILQIVYIKLNQRIEIENYSNENSVNSILKNILRVIILLFMILKINDKRFTPFKKKITTRVRNKTNIIIQLF